MAGHEQPNLIAVDLGAESCRVSLLDWPDGQPRIRLVDRFPNQPVSHHGSLRWPLEGIVSGVISGISRCAGLCTRIDAIGVDGWAVDYVRLDAEGNPLGLPHCYRDARTEGPFAKLEASGVHRDLFRQTGAQPLRINTIYQLMADADAGIPSALRWVNLPEYVLGLLCGRFVSEYTNATHTGLVDAHEHRWRESVFQEYGLGLEAAQDLVECGTLLGPIRTRLVDHPALARTQIIAPACHDTASAIAALSLEGEDWAYISSGTWSLIGVVVPESITTDRAYLGGFTNQGAAGDRVSLQKNVNGMWLLKQAILQLSPDDPVPLPELIAAAARAPAPDGLLDVDAPELLLPGPMATVINRQRRAHGFREIEESNQALPIFASLIFRSLADRYRVILQDLAALTGRHLQRLVIAGGGSQNEFLNRLTAEVTGLQVECGVAESSTVGNFAVQLASLDGKRNDPGAIHSWSRLLAGAASAQANHSNR